MYSQCVPVPIPRDPHGEERINVWGSGKPELRHWTLIKQKLCPELPKTKAHNLLHSTESYPSTDRKCKPSAFPDQTLSLSQIYNLYAAPMEEKGSQTLVQFKGILLKMELSKCRAKVQNFILAAIERQWIIVWPNEDKI